MSNTVQTNKSNEEKIKEYHRKKLLKLSLKSIGKSPKLEEPTDEQKQWVKKHGF